LVQGEYDHLGPCTGHLALVKGKGLTNIPGKAHRFIIEWSEKWVVPQYIQYIYIRHVFNHIFNHLMQLSSELMYFHHLSIKHVGDTGVVTFTCNGYCASKPPPLVGMF
jgi:hypothetical protein